MNVGEYKSGARFSGGSVVCRKLPTTSIDYALDFGNVTFPPRIRVLYCALIVFVVRLSYRKWPHLLHFAARAFAILGER